MMWLRGLALVTTFTAAAAAMVPLRTAWATGNPHGDLAVADVSGTIWGGRLTGVAWRGIALGDFDASISPLELLPTPALRLTNGTGPLKAAVLRVAHNRLDVSGASIVFSFGEVVPGSSRDLAARIIAAEVGLHDGRCTSAAGRIETPAASSIGLPAFSGTLSCDQGVLLAHLSSGAETMVLELATTLDHVAYRSASPALDIALTAAGIPPAQRP